MTVNLGASSDGIVGRELEMRRLRAAIQNRESQLVWGESDAGKTFLIQRVIAGLSEADRRKCVCWTGAASARQPVSHLIRGLFLAGDPFVRSKVRTDRHEREAKGFLDHLLEMNSARVQSDVVNRVQESRAQLEVEIRKLLHELSHIAERALEHACAVRSEGASAVEAAIARLDATDRAIQSLQIKEEQRRQT